MAASIEVEIAGSVPSAGVYRVTWRTLTATDMTAEIFLYEYAGARMQRVCTPADLAYPDVRTAGQPFYRQDNGYLDYSSIADAEAAKTAMRAAIQSLVTEQNAGLTAFTTTVTEVFS